MKFKSYRKQITDKLTKKEEMALKAIGLFVEGEAKLRSPVDTGNLRSSIDHKVQDTSVAIGTNTEYAIFQEKGSRFQPAQPYLEPSVMQNRNKIKSLAEQYLKE